MPLPPWQEQEISRSHDRTAFDCGNNALNDYLKRYARQNHESRYTRTFVLVSSDDQSRILGYYSLSNASVEFTQIPESLAKQLPQYPVPAVRLSRLARDISCKGHGLGPSLLLCAVERALRATEHSGAALLIIDAIDEKAAKFYQRHDGMPLQDFPLTLIMSLASAAAAIRETVDKAKGAD